MNGRRYLAPSLSVFALVSLSSREFSVMFCNLFSTVSAFSAVSSFIFCSIGSHNLKNTVHLIFCIVFFFFCFSRLGTGTFTFYEIQTGYLLLHTMGIYIFDALIVLYVVDTTLPMIILRDNLTGVLVIITYSS